MLNLLLLHRLARPLRFALACAAPLALVALLVVPSATGAEDEPSDGASGAKPKINAPAPEAAARQMRLPSGFNAEVFAAEPRLANPVCISIDEQGRFYVVETYRRRGEVLDVRGNAAWLDDDLASRTVADRIALVKKHYPPAKWRTMIGPTDRVKRIEDRDGDGKADADTVFATGFDQLESGTAAGVLARDGKVWFTDIPDLWLLRDTDNDGKADQRTALHTGFGVRYGFSGHDLHGLRMGPDGRLYFSIGDRALHIEKDGKVIASSTEAGAVLRCEPDGSNLEVFHNGLRNPQELAFDAYGNLFTGDNNSDAGDATRWVYVVEGGESGWRVGWQHAQFPQARGAWNSEKLWAVAPPVPAHYRLPPIANPPISGPAGLTYAPGTGMPASFADRFLLVDFRGGAAGGSGVYALQNKPKGASFELTEVKPLATGVLATDVEFGWTGGVYITDWVAGWAPTGAGRIYHVFDPGAAADPVVAETRKLMAEGMEKRPVPDLAKLLGHADARVRQAAQFELARHDEIAALASVAKENASVLARIHAIWGLGQIGRRRAPAAQSAAAQAAEAVETAGAGADAMAPVAALLADADPEIRAQAANVLGDARHAPAGAALEKQLKDRSPRVQFFAALALGHLQYKPAVPAVLEMLRKNRGADAYVAHAGVMALLWMNDSSAIATAAGDGSSAVRMAALLVERRRADPAVAAFLSDPDPDLVLEAARAINDLPIEPALPRLAALATTRPANLAEPLLTPVMMRAINANYRTGTSTAAASLVSFAARGDVDEALRVEALRMLGDWSAPPGRDRVTSLWRPVPPRDPAVARAALEPALMGLLRTGPAAVKVAALSSASALGVTTAPLAQLFSDPANPSELRAAALGAMAQRKDPHLAASVRTGLGETVPAVRLAAIHLQPRVGPLDPLETFLKNGTPAEQQAVLQALADVSTKDRNAKQADAMLLSAFDSLERGALPPEATLDLLMAASNRKSGPVADHYKTYRSAEGTPSAADPLAGHRAALYGGDARRGESIFRDRADVSCMRCHSIGGAGGNAGPDLAGVGSRGDRPYLLESILAPNRKISPGWETVTLGTTDGDPISGVFKGEDAASITLDVPEQGAMKIDKAKVKSRQGGMSAMPEDISKTLTDFELRDLVEFLANLKQPAGAK